MAHEDRTMEDRADTIARDIKRTQDDIGETVEAIEEKLNPREIGRSLIGDEGVDLVREAIDVTRRNPLPVAMIAIGSIWLLATSRSPLFRRIRDGVREPFSGDSEGMDLRSRAEEPAPIGPPPLTGETYDRAIKERIG